MDDKFPIVLFAILAGTMIAVVVIIVLQHVLALGSIPVGLNVESGAGGFSMAALLGIWRLPV